MIAEFWVYLNLVKMLILFSFFQIQFPLQTIYILLILYHILKFIAFLTYIIFHALAFNYFFNDYHLFKE